MALVGASARGESRRGDLSKVECFCCHKLGHIARDCIVLKGRTQSRVRVATISDDDRSDSDDVLCLVGDANDEGDIAHSWPVDSEASAHMCWIRFNFEDSQNTTGLSVTMGDKGSAASDGRFRDGHSQCHRARQKSKDYAGERASCSHDGLQSHVGRYDRRALCGRVLQEW